MRKLFNEVSEKCSKITTQNYSTSFSMGILFLSKEIQTAIYNIYGFVRFADEIVDTFHDQDQKEILDEFESETKKAINRGFSINPILNSFQETVNEYKIDYDLIDQFLYSMKMDLEPQFYDQNSYEKYILGSAEVVGLMCLKVFTLGNEEQYNQLTFSAMKLGSAFQKINFLRDLKEDYQELGRTYFPNVDMSMFNNSIKKEIEKDIQTDFEEAYKGLINLPKSSRFGVYLAYKYYIRLFNKIKKLDASVILKERVRIPNEQKFALTLSSYVKHQLNLM